MDRRIFLLGLLAASLCQLPSESFGKGGDSGSGSSGHGNEDHDNHDEDDDHDEDVRDDASSAVERGEIKPLSIILAVALADTPGQVIDVRLKHSSAKFLYRIKILTPRGRKRELRIDARNLNIIWAK